MADTAYSPGLRTGVVLTGAGTAGAYHAGALRAIAESGIRVDVVAAHGAGALTALASAVDGGPRVWDPAGPWTDARLHHAYRWRPALRVAWGGLLACFLLLLSPLVVLILAAAIYALATLAGLVSLTGVSTALVGWYSAALAWLFDPPMMPTIVPRLLVLGVLVIAGVLVAASWRAARVEGSRRRRVGAFWWRLLSWPLDATEPSAIALDLLWQQVHGASSDKLPVAEALGRRYVDVLTDNFGEPGFHEVLIGVHDIDARRDVVGAVLSASGRAAIETSRGGLDDRAGEIVDFTGPQRDMLAGFLAGAFRLPVVTAPAVVAYGADDYWRGERHRVCDRPDLVSRLVGEIAALGVEQIILIGPAPRAARPHGIRATPIGLRARMGELVRSLESAALTDAVAVAASRCSSVFVVRPDHNPIGPFDFAGVYDESSDRLRTVAELMQQGYADAYHRLIEPMVAAADASETIG
ncbi:MAG: hypothetical protein ABS36_09805 [Acidobacteria bacterium SCN 69-37]|nr:MAG: hypothetical protein ABS36_09805 [Acidobacteria bacterium SCN 69-37]